MTSVRVKRRVLVVRSENRSCRVYTDSTTSQKMSRRKHFPFGFAVPMRLSSGTRYVKRTKCVVKGSFAAPARAGLSVKHFGYCLFNTSSQVNVFPALFRTFTVVIIDLPSFAMTEWVVRIAFPAFMNVVSRVLSFDRFTKIPSERSSPEICPLPPALG